VPLKGTNINRRPGAANPLDSGTYALGQVRENVRVTSAHIEAIACTG
jgi:hypothetical protein